MDERTRQGAERFHYPQAAGRAAGQADAWDRATGQTASQATGQTAGRAAGQAASQATGQAARAADAARSALPGGIRSGQGFEGTLFQRRLATVF